jgi:hypothetical protein
MWGQPPRLSRKGEAERFSEKLIRGCNNVEERRFSAALEVRKACGL